jgi:hypothetical protein
VNLVEHRPESVFFDLKVVAGLQVHPEPFGSPEEASQAQGGIGTDPSLAVHDLVDPPRWHGDRARQLILAEFQRLEELGKEDLARMHWRHDHFVLHLPLLVVVNDLDILGSCV